MGKGFNMPANQRKNRIQSGFTLIEVLIGLAILTMAVGPLLAMMVQAGKTNAMAVREQTAMLAARNQLESLYDEEYETLFLQQGMQPWKDGTLQVEVCPAGDGDDQWVHWIVWQQHAMLVLPDGTFAVGNGSDALTISHGASGYSWRWGSNIGTIGPGQLSVWCVARQPVNLTVARNVLVKGYGAISCSPSENLTVSNTARSDGLVKVRVVATPAEQPNLPTTPAVLEAVLRVPLGEAR